MDFIPDRTVRAPGRVNLIGEHVDYAGLPVFPMALQYAVHIAVRPRDDGLVRVTSSDPDYESREFELGPEIEPFPDGDWGNYVKAAAVAAAARYGADRGADLWIDSQVPVAAGLSSSSALVVAVLKALLDVSDIEVDPIELAAVAADAEQYVGTRGGGMDQAISVCALEQCAARIEFGSHRSVFPRTGASWLPIPECRPTSPATRRRRTTSAARLWRNRSRSSVRNSAWRTAIELMLDCFLSTTRAS
jgi:galactokinase